MRFTIYEYYRGTDSVIIDIPDEKIKEIAMSCDNREDFIDTVKEYVSDYKWDYETDREQIDTDFDDWEYSDDFDEHLEKLEEEYEDYFNSSAKNVGEFGND